MICVLEAIEYFTAVRKRRDREPSLGLVSVTNETARSIEQLFAASRCQGGPGPSFLAQWVYYYLVGGVETILLYYKNLKISPTSKFYTFYSQETKNY